VISSGNRCIKSTTQTLVCPLAPLVDQISYGIGYTKRAILVSTGRDTFVVTEINYQ
jgi:hypothetical protein